MPYTISDIAAASDALKAEFDKLEDKKAILRSPVMRDLVGKIKNVAPEDRKTFGQELNQLKTELSQWVSAATEIEAQKAPIDVTAPFDVNVPLDKKPSLLRADIGTSHPLMQELDYILDILHRLGFSSVESRQVDDDYHMFESLNFPEGHPARDDYDTFMTTNGLIAPAHTSTMQNRVLKANKHKLVAGEPIAVAIPGRVFRNEDLDVTHEHTFYQLEGVYVDKGVNVGNLIATLRAFMSEYFGQELKAKIQPFYFPFTEPSFEFAIERPDALKKGDAEADQWLELLGCGMIHPNVLKAADIDPNVYTGFAWGCGIERLVLMKYGIEDIRHFESAKLEFLRKF